MWTEAAGKESLMIGSSSRSGGLGFKSALRNAGFIVIGVDNCVLTLLRCLCCTDLVEHSNS